MPVLYLLLSRFSLKERVVCDATYTRGSLIIHLYRMPYQHELQIFGATGVDCEKVLWNPV